MATIVSATTCRRRPAPPSSFARWLDQLGPVLLLAAVLAVLAAAAYQARATDTAPLAVARMMAE